MKIGARTLKTGLAIFISLSIPYLLGIPDASSLAGISSIYSMQPSVRKSFSIVKERILANAIGGLVAVAITLLFGNHYIFIGLAAALLISILHQMNLNNVIGLAGVTLIVIMLSQTQSVVLEASVRVLGTIIGVLVTFVINSLILPPKYDDRLYSSIELTTDKITKYLRTSLRKNVQYPIISKDLAWMKKEISQMENLLSLLNDETTWYTILKSERFRVHARKIVVFRQFIETIKAAYNLIETLHYSENVYNHFPEELRILMRERLETLMSAHEQILLKFDGRILPDEVNFIAYKSDLRREFMDSFFNEASLEAYTQNDYGQSNSVLHIMSAVLSYEENLQHLNVLVRSLKKHHDEKDDEFQEWMPNE
ncbi:FUSC family protein [Lacticigenium naphthae]|uniref:FUSC family protein n=1 Tax=Lacticigenium naphthae TaxID=515351 RepID=UPI0003F670DA|nr:aromatic acid exporter family protein [Lacticigenium naphthae]